MKDPRWPEFYIPAWLSAGIAPHTTLAEQNVSLPELQRFIAAAVTALKDHPALTSWQVENEPLQPAGPQHLKISPGLVRLEIDLLRQLDPERPITLTLWANHLLRPLLWWRLYQLKGYQQLGFDIYPKMYTPNGYQGPDLFPWLFKQLCKLVKRRGVEPIITELQAEPWEEAFDYRQFPERIQSISPAQLQKNIADYAYLGFTEVYLWGAEYWVWSKQQEKLLMLFD